MVRLSAHLHVASTTQHNNTRGKHKSTQKQNTASSFPTQDYPSTLTSSSHHVPAPTRSAHVATRYLSSTPSPSRSLAHCTAKRVDAPLASRSLLSIQHKRTNGRRHTHPQRTPFLRLHSYLLGPPSAIPHSYAYSHARLTTRWRKKALPKNSYQQNQSVFSYFMLVCVLVEGCVLD